MAEQAEPKSGEPCSETLFLAETNSQSVLPKDIKVGSEICKFYLVNKCRFGDECLNLHEGEVKEGKKKSKKPVENSEKKEKGKKPSMKTALDVIKRIKWDSDFTQEYFVVGYLDRFLGVVEEQFTAFVWEDLATLDWDVLAIPQHRIQYFKYKNAKVWDKNERLDIVFGSTGSKVGILEFMDQVDTNIRDNPSPVLDSDSDSDSDSESGETKINFKPQNHEQTHTRILEEDRSTHFLALKINCKTLKSELVKVQETLVSKEEILRDCCMKEDLFHMTLGMFRLMDIQGIQLAVDMVESIKEEAEKILKAGDNTLEVKHLNNFGHRVLYAEIHPKDPVLFKNFIEFIKTKFESLGEKVQSTNSFDFIPHITLAKVSRPISRIRRSQFIDESFYDGFKDKYFGAQGLDNLQLCIIESSTRFDGFYTTLAHVNI